MNVSSATLPTNPVRTSAGGFTPITGGKSIADKFTPSGDTMKKGAYAAVYMGIPFVAGLVGGGSAVASYGSMALGAGAGVYAAREGTGLQKAMNGLSGFVVASSCNTIGKFAVAPSVGGLVGVGLGALMIYTSGRNLMSQIN